MKALIIIDVQNGLFKNKIYNADDFIRNINKEIAKNRKENNLIIFIQHNSASLKKNTKEWDLFHLLDYNKNDVVIQKKHPDAFSDTKLTETLLEKGIKDIIISGLVSHGCVKLTCESGVKNGFNVKLLKNGHSNWLKNAEEKINEVNTEMEKLGIELI